MNRTGIEYLDFTWNPLAMRCDPVSAGCAHCWHLDFAARLAANPAVKEEERKAMRGGPALLRRDELDAPMRRKKPARIGVQFMGDLFHEAVSFEQIMAVWDIMEVCPQHTFLILTKRAWRMNNVVEPRNEPLENVLLSVTAENQTRADERIPLLLQTPAAVRWVSLEPLLERIDLAVPYGQGVGELLIDGLGWVVVGSESGPKRRPCRLEWIEDVVRQCEAAGVPVFVKQAEVGGKLVKAPVILGRKRLEMPKGVKP